MSIADCWSYIQQVLLAENPARRDSIGTLSVRAAAGGGELVLATGCPEAAAWLQSVLERVRQLLPHLDGAPPQVSVQLEAGAAPPPPQPPATPPLATAAASPRPAPAAAASGLAAKYTFDSFVAGSSNQLAFGAARQLAAGGENLCPLYIHGHVGLGKTHLANAIGNEYLQRNPRARLRLLSGEQFMREVQRDFTSDRVDEFRRRFRQLDLLIIDDIQLIGRESGQTHKQLIALFNFLGDQSRPFAVVSDSAIGQLQLPERLLSRLGSGVQAHISPPDPETRRRLLERQATALGLALDEDCCRLLAENLRSNCRELIGAMRRLAATAGLQPQRPLREIANEVLTDLHQIPVRITVGCIIDAVAASFGIDRGLLRSKRRTRSLAHARHVAMYLCRELTAESLPGIGAAFGCHHSSVLHGHRRIAAAAATDLHLAADLQQIRQRLEARRG